MKRLLVWGKWARYPGKGWKRKFLIRLYSRSFPKNMKMLPISRSYIYSTEIPQSTIPAKEQLRYTLRLRHGGRSVKDLLKTLRKSLRGMHPEDSKAFYKAMAKGYKVYRNTDSGRNGVVMLASPRRKKGKRLSARRGAQVIPAGTAMEALGPGELSRLEGAAPDTFDIALRRIKREASGRRRVQRAIDAFGKVMAEAKAEGGRKSDLDRIVREISGKVGVAGQSLTAADKEMIDKIVSDPEVQRRAMELGIDTGKLREQMISRWSSLKPKIEARRKYIESGGYERDLQKKYESEFKALFAKRRRRARIAELKGELESYGPERAWKGLYSRVSGRGLEEATRRNLINRLDMAIAEVEDRLKSSRMKKKDREEWKSVRDSLKRERDILKSGGPVPPEAQRRLMAGRAYGGGRALRSGTVWHGFAGDIRERKEWERKVDDSIRELQRRYDKVKKTKKKYAPDVKRGILKDIKDRIESLKIQRSVGRGVHPKKWLVEFVKRGKGLKRPHWEDQPRIPKGQPGAGRWTKVGGTRNFSRASVIGPGGARIPLSRVMRYTGRPKKLRRIVEEELSRRMVVPPGEVKEATSRVMKSLAGEEYLDYDVIRSKIDEEIVRRMVPQPVPGSREAMRGEARLRGRMAEINISPPLDVDVENRRRALARIDEMRKRLISVIEDKGADEADRSSARYLLKKLDERRNAILESASMTPGRLRSIVSEDIRARHRESMARKKLPGMDLKMARVREEVMGGDPSVRKAMARRTKIAKVRNDLASKVRSIEDRLKRTLLYAENLRREMSGMKGKVKKFNSSVWSRAGSPVKDPEDMLRRALAGDKSVLDDLDKIHKATPGIVESAKKKVRNIVEEGMNALVDARTLLGGAEEKLKKVDAELVKLRKAPFSRLSIGEMKVAVEHGIPGAREELERRLSLAANRLVAARRTIPPEQLRKMSIRDLRKLARMGNVSASRELGLRITARKVGESAAEAASGRLAQVGRALEKAGLLKVRDREIPRPPEGMWDELLEIVGMTKGGVLAPGVSEGSVRRMMNKMVTRWRREAEMNPTATPEELRMKMLAAASEEARKISVTGLKGALSREEGFAARPRVKVRKEDVMAIYEQLRKEIVGEEAPKEKRQVEQPAARKVSRKFAKNAAKLMRREGITVEEAIARLGASFSPKEVMNAIRRLKKSGLRKLSEHRIRSRVKRILDHVMMV